MSTPSCCAGACATPSKRAIRSLELAELLSLLEEHAYWRDWGYADFCSCLHQQYRISPRTPQRKMSALRFPFSSPSPLKLWGGNAAGVGLAANITGYQERKDALRW
jgi:hypothetical protein